MISNKAKNMSSAGHIQQSLKTGQEGQQRFYDSCRAAGKTIKKTSESDDIKNHTDFVVDGEGFDVKGLKQTQKEGKILLEIKNVVGKMVGVTINLDQRGLPLIMVLSSCVLITLICMS